MDKVTFIEKFIAVEGTLDLEPEAF